MARGPDLERVKRLTAASKRAKKGDKLSHTELAHLWGVAKGTFTNLRNRIADFPPAEDGPRGQSLYDAPAAVKALLEHETQADAAEQQRAERAQEILGTGKRRGRRGKQKVFLGADEMLKLSRLRAEIEERERLQGEYIHRDEVRDAGARVYGVLNGNLSNLEDRVDPNGLLPADQRKKLGELGRATLLEMGRELSDTLGVDVDGGTNRAAKPAQKARGANKPRARRKR